MSVEVVPHNKGSKRLFENKFLERLTRTHIAIPITLFIVYAGALLYYNIKSVGTLNAWQTTGLFFAGLLVFTLVEYLVHRYIFHIDTSTERKAKLQYTLHGVHHEYPKDKERLAMPPIMSITIATLLLFVFRLFMGDLVFAFLPGFLLGYAAYLFTHYILHAYKAPKGFFNFLWANHAIHHYKDQTVVFGVTSPLWDYVFGTMPKKDKK